MNAPKMTKFGITALVSSALGAAVIGLAAPATAAPSETSDHHNISTIDTLGYSVVSDKTIDAIQRD